MKTAAMILAIVAFGAAMINLWKFYHWKTEALRANGDRWPGLKSWMWNAPLWVRDFQGHAKDFAVASTKAGIVFMFVLWLQLLRFRQRTTISILR